MRYFNILYRESHAERWRSCSIICRTSSTPVYSLESRPPAAETVVLQCELSSAPDSLQHQGGLCSVLYRVYWGERGKDRERKTLNKLVRRASSVLGCPLDQIKEAAVAAAADRQKGVGQADIRHGQHFQPPAPHCGDPEQHLQRKTFASPAQEAAQGAAIPAHSTSGSSSAQNNCAMRTSL